MSLISLLYEIFILLIKEMSKLWQYGLWSFQTTKLERLLPNNQHTERKLLNFENWVNGLGVKNWA